MQAGVGLLVTDVMPIYMIMPRYSHNYSLFYQLLDSNLFTHRNTYAILREATSETYGPRVYLPSYYISFPLSHLVYYFAIFTFQSIQQKCQKYLLYYLYQISLLQVTVKGLTTPLLRWLRVLCLFL